MHVVIIFKCPAYFLLFLHEAIHAVRQRTVKSLLNDHRIVDILQASVLLDLGYLSHFGGNSPALVFAYNLAS